MVPYLIFIGGILLGSLFTYLLLRVRTSGNLRIVESNEPGEQPYLFVELDRPVHEIRKCKHVTFNISLK